MEKEESRHIVQIDREIEHIGRMMDNTLVKYLDIKEAKKTLKEAHDLFGKKKRGILKTIREVEMDIDHVGKDLGVIARAMEMENLKLLNLKEAKRVLKEAQDYIRTAIKEEI